MFIGDTQHTHPTGWLVFVCPKTSIQRLGVLWGLDKGGAGGVTLFSSESEAQLARYFISFHLFFNSFSLFGLGGIVEGLALRVGEFVSSFFRSAVQTWPGRELLPIISWKNQFECTLKCGLKLFSIVVSTRAGSILCSLFVWVAFAASSVLLFSVEIS